MTRRSISGLLLATAVIFVFFVAPTWAVPTASVAFDAATQTVKVAITGGNDTTYTAHVVGIGCVDTLFGSVDLQGPEDSGSVSLVCIEPSSSGQAEISFCLEQACFDTKYVDLICGSTCVMSEAGHVPALSDWGLIVLILLIAGSAIWVIRRKRVPAR